MFKQDMEQNILKIQTLITNQIEFDYSYMEFTDGIYDIKINKFYPKNNIKINKFYNVATHKYYNKSYNWVRQNIPQA
jgi:hypothetical protein